MNKLDSTSYSLRLLRRNEGEIREFAEFASELVLEADKKSIKEEIKKIKSRFHIDHCWIMKNEQKLGIVKILRNSFYNLGLPSDLLKDEIKEILKTVEKDISTFHSYNIEGTLHSKFIPIALECNYQVLFSRKKMVLHFEKAKNLADFHEINIQGFRRNIQDDLTDVFIDAYSESVDEKIGMFDRSIAYSAIRSIMSGEFGEFKQELSASVYSNDGTEMIAGILITILENSPFVVIIGVSRKLQGKQIGRKLMSWVIDKSMKLGYDRMQLWVTIENKIASSLYDSLGFEEILSISSIGKSLL